MTIILHGPTSLVYISAQRMKRFYRHEPSAKALNAILRLLRVDMMAKGMTGIHAVCG